jgi:arylsulfatase A-like enzyme
MAQTALRPNIVLIFADDLGYADLGCYGSPNIRTPRLDRMAAEGARLTSFYAQPVCGPSRTAILTGCYPPRLSLSQNLGPGSRTGLHPNEITVARSLKNAGYSTAMFGKWHLGHKPPYLPTKHGFDRYYGLPYSNDMWPYHPRNVEEPDEHPRMKAARARAQLTGWDRGDGPRPRSAWYPDLPLIEREETVELNPDLSKLTGNYTERAVGFIRENRRRPFFLYVAHNMPHVPLFPGEKFRGKSRAGLYGDVVEELDWSVGRILDTLKSEGLDDRTLVMFTSDNGPWLPYGIDAGSAGPLRAGKATQYDGGFRVPFIARYPGRIPAGVVSSEIVASIDMFPTLTKLAGAKLAPNGPIDGVDVWPLLSGAQSRSPRDEFLFFGGSAPGAPIVLNAIRRGRWKLHLRLPAGTFEPVALYDLDEDIGERFDRRDRQAEVVRELVARAESVHSELSANVRPQGPAV